MTIEFGTVDVSGCTEVTPDCPVEATLYGDYFNTGACAFYAAVFGLAALAQLGLGWRSKTWSYTAYLFIGTLFEMIGYVGRVRMSINPFIVNAFVMQSLFLVLAPTLIAAAISLTFKHLVLYYGPEMSMIRPRLYPWVFVGSDFVSIIIQGIGGAIAASGSTGDNFDPDKADLGNNLLIAGVSFQVVNMAVCGALMLVYLRRYRKAWPSGFHVIGSGSGGGVLSNEQSAMVASHRTTESDKRLKLFLYAITAAYVAIIIRCIYRIPEMAAGWGSSIMRNEATFMIFDGAMILVAVLLLTIVHPLWFFPFLSKKPPGFIGEKKPTNDSSTDPDTRQYEMQDREAKV